MNMICGRTVRAAVSALGLLALMAGLGGPAMAGLSPAPEIDAGSMVNAMLVLSGSLLMRRTAGTVASEAPSGMASHFRPWAGSGGGRSSIAPPPVIFPRGPRNWESNNLAGTWSIGRVAVMKEARRPALYWSAMLALLAVEVLALTLRFDSEHLIGRHGWLAVVIQRPGQLISLGITVGAMLGLLLFGVARGGERVGSPDRDVRPGSPSLALAPGPPGDVRRAVPAHPVDRRGAGGRRRRGDGDGLRPLDRVGGEHHGPLDAGRVPTASWWRLARARWGTLLAIATAGVAAILLGRWTATLWGSFHGPTFWAVRGVLGLFYRDVVCRPDAFILGTPRFGVEISAQCSGFEGIGLIWVFLGVFCWWSRASCGSPRRSCSSRSGRC